jgi:hypothetical protein
MVYDLYLLFTIPTRIFLEKECRSYANSEGFRFNQKKDTCSGSKNVSFVVNGVN